MKYLIVAFLIFSSCDDDASSPETQGCMDISACNYNIKKESI